MPSCMTHTIRKWRNEILILERPHLNSCSRWLALLAFQIPCLGSPLVLAIQNSKPIELFSLWAAFLPPPLLQASALPASFSPVDSVAVWGDDWFCLSVSPSKVWRSVGADLFPFSAKRYSGTMISQLLEKQKKVWLIDDQPDLCLGPPQFHNESSNSLSSELEANSSRKRKNCWEAVQNSIELHLTDPLPVDWEQCLDLEVTAFSFFFTFLSLFLSSTCTHSNP